jgi:TatD DNase family protein
VAVGEIGLDYYKSLSAKEKQKQAFLEFINFAKKLNLPLILHSRESHLDMLEILKAERVDFSKVVFHCFSGDQDFLNRCLDLGVMFSFTGNITYPKATRLRELISRIPLDKIMLETDSPYLAPQKFRGQRNEPAYVHFVAQELAIIKKKNIQEIADITTQNAKRFFKLEP